MTQATVFKIQAGGDESFLGGKGLRLGELVAMGCSVPKGFTVTAGVLDAVIDATGLDATIDTALKSVDPQDDASCDKAAKDIADAICAVTLPDQIAADITTAYEQLCFETRTLTLQVAVRSSAVGEDAKDASFAGQFETYLGVSGTEAVIAHIKRVWASLYNARAIQYRARNGLGLRGQMAVVVLELVNARAAGVAFSADPLTGKRDRIVIEGNWGFGESVVQGVVTPDRATVDKADLRVLDYTVSEKVIVSVYEPDQRLVVEVPAPTLFRKQAVLNDEEVIAIAKALREVEETAGYPIDVEWVIPMHRQSGDAPVLVQVRPITTLPDAETTPSAAWNPAAYASKYAFGSQ
jgi:pyruvate,water dikinase